MARPTGWDILGLDGDPTPGVVESVQALAKEFGDFAHDVESAYRSLNSFGNDSAALEWVGQTAEAFKSHYGPLPGRLQKLYTSYSEASDALSAYAPQLQAAQSKADSALRQAQDANVDLQRATTTANGAAADLKTAQQNHAANPSPNPQAVTDAQTAHDTAQTNLNNAKARMAALTTQANQAHDDRINAAKTCAKAIGHAQHDGIHNKSWWQHLGEDLSKWGGEIGQIAGELAPVLDVIALATSWIPGVDVVTAALAEADNIIALAGTAVGAIGDAMQGHWGDALLGAGMLALTFVGGRALGSAAEDAEGEAGAVVREGDALGPETNSIGDDARVAEGNGPANTEDDPVDVVSGWMLTDATDIELPGVLPVVLRRAYASGYATGHLFGPGWSSTLDQRISINEAGIHFAGDDGQRLDYPLPSAGETVLPDRGSRWPLVWDRETDEVRICDPWSGEVRHFPVVHFGNEFGQIRDLTAISDRNGTRIDVHRDADGVPTLVEHPGYRVTVDTVPTNGGPRISALRLMDDDDTGTGVVVKQFQYDARGRLTGVVNSSGLPFTYEWDENDRITAWRDRSGYRYGYHYDAIGRVVQGEGRFLAGSFAYDPENRTTVHTNSLGHVTTFIYDEFGHVVSETDPLGHTTITETDRYGRVLVRVNALGDTTRYERDEAGDVRRIVEPDGSASELEYNRLHQIVTVTMADGAQWHRDYDARGNLISVADPAGNSTRFAYGANGALAEAINPLGAVTRFITDRAGLSVGAADPVGGQTHAVRNSAGRVIQVTDPLGAITATEWTLEGSPVAQTRPDGAVTRWRYDPDGRLLEHIDPLGAVTAFEPGPMETLLARTGPDGVRHAFAYDSEMNLLAVSNPEGAQWSYQYDPIGQLVGETDFIGRTQSYEYDEIGRLKARINGAGQRITLDRDAAGHVVAHHTPDGDYQYSYDTGGRLLAATGPGSTLAFEYDQCSRIAAETVDGRTVRYRYDAAGRLVHRTTPSGAESAWTYDAAGRAAGLDAGSGSLHFEFDAAGREIERAIGLTAWLSHEYDVAGRPVAQQVWVSDETAGGAAGPGPSRRSALSRDWIWRADGAPEEIRDSLRGARRFASDTTGRVTAVSARDWSESYAYDGFGNVIVASSGEGATDAASGPDTAIQASVVDRTLLRRSRRTDHEYDAAGRLVRTVRRTLDGRSQVWEYTWDSRDRLVQAVTPDRGTWRYIYDPMGRRSAKQRIDTDGTVVEQTTFSWHGPNLVEQHTQRPDGTWAALTWDYEPASFRPAAQRHRTWADDAEQNQIDEAFHAIITDLIGTPTELIAPDGHIAWHTTTSLWGRTITAGADPGLDCPLRFPGQYHDAETGLHYNLHRYYSPDLATYIAPDPLGLSAAPNDHAYVPNPLTFSDPFGLAYGSQWHPDENYTPDEIAARNAQKADDYEYMNTPQEVHDLVNTVRNNPNFPPRTTNGVTDYFEGKNLSPKGKSFWQSWIHNPNGQAGAKIFWNFKPNSQTRIMVHPTTGDIAWFPLDSQGVHNYGSPILYKW
ncbi:hypothetical protein KGQ19_12790 [Catenulispora sp. NL8]|uniref:YD repeat protein n=1 Tax=Catenulispora pinistramenti TaxID=2705254 RepID=A0ABS5KNW9_9ACTN|nr:RHS repeat-associated core domain-containing protein [Catenulispora pinistramenti]MBS2547744.1 hypothetical protein [Catenulispora pinistramenti]